MIIVFLFVARLQIKIFACKIVGLQCMTDFNIAEYVTFSTNSENKLSTQTDAFLKLTTDANNGLTTGANNGLTTGANGLTTCSNRIPFEFLNDVNDQLQKQITKSIHPSQDRQQRVIVTYEFFLELYRIIIGTCLITFVPQTCGDQICRIMQNVFIGKYLYDIAFYMNIFTLCCFMVLYVIEMVRENYLIQYLEVNLTLPFDNFSVGEVIQRLDVKKKEMILKIDHYHVCSGYFCMFFFMVNTFFSGSVILVYSFNNKTITGFITNILFLMIKLRRIYIMVHSDKNTFYSAFMSQFVQFNDLDPHEKRLLDLQQKNTEYNLEHSLENDSFSLEIENDIEFNYDEVFDHHNTIE